MREMSMNEVAAEETTGVSSTRILPLLLLMFVGSGCSALIYEVVWFQLLELVIGVSTVSLGILLGTFMAGMCLGSLLFGLLCDAARIYIKDDSVGRAQIEDRSAPFDIIVIGENCLTSLIHSGIYGLAHSNRRIKAGGEINGGAVADFKLHGDDGGHVACAHQGHGGPGKGVLFRGARTFARVQKGETQGAVVS